MQATSARSAPSTWLVPAGPQVLTLAPWILAVGEPGKLSKALLMLAAWVNNLAVAEWVIRRPARAARPAPIPHPVLEAVR
jgi:hypothetical protein